MKVESTENDEINQAALQQNVQAVYEQMKTSPNGLTKQEIKARQAQVGKNVLQKSQGRTDVA